jgi:enoyl-CoA hydratase/carnithine racemase
LADGRVLLERDQATGIARITLNNPERRNTYDPPMRRQLAEYLDDLAMDDAVKVVLLRGEGGVFSTGADMGNAYSWYDAPDGDGATRRRRPSQRRRLSVDRQTFSFYHDFMGYPKATVAEVQGYALGGGLELALMADIAVVGRETKIGMPGVRLLGPALGSIHMFFHRLGPVLARRLLLTGDTISAGSLEHLGVFTEVVDDADVTKRAFRLVEQMQAYQGEEVASYLFHAYGTNLQFDEGEFNFVKARAEHGTKKAFQLRDEHFEVPEP